MRRVRPFRVGLWLGILAAVAFVVAKYLQSRRPEPASAPAPVPRPVPTPRPTPPAAAAPGPSVLEPRLAPAPPVIVPEAAVAPAPVAKKAAKKRAAAKKKAAAPVARVEPAWVAPDDAGICPASHPVKAKLSSKLFHLEGMFAYARTNPDRCYRDPEAAEADGLTRAKR